MFICSSRNAEASEALTDGVLGVYQAEEMLLDEEDSAGLQLDCYTLITNFSVSVRQVLGYSSVQ